MPKKKCSFSGAAMMLTPGLDPSDCPNYRACGSATDLTPEEHVELVRVREVQRQQREAEREQAQQEWERIQEEIRVNRHKAAVLMLMMRGCPQTSESLGVLNPLAEIETQLAALRSHLESFEECYIAPEGCEAHRYNVKRPWGVFEPTFRTSNWHTEYLLAHRIFKCPSVAETGERWVEVRNLTYAITDRTLNTLV